MKNTIITSDTIKVIDSPFNKNSKGKYNPKNELLLEYATKCTKIKLGESILLNFIHTSKVRIGKAIEDNIEYNTNSDLLKVNELVNFFDNFSLCFDDRIFRVAQNNNGQFLVYCLSIKNQFSTIYVKDKNSISKHFENVRNPISNDVYSVEVVDGKGKRKIEDDDIVKIKSSFNSMLGKGFNKPLAIKVEKTA